MHLRTVDYALIAADAEEVNHLQHTSLPTPRSKRFNTARHTRQEILTTVPEPTSFTHKSPPWTAYGYVLWRSMALSFHLTGVYQFVHGFSRLKVINSGDTVR